MNRRKFIKAGALFVPATFGVFVPRVISADSYLQNRRQAFRRPAAGGGASCPADGSPDQEHATSDNVQNLTGGLNHFAGQKNWSNASTREICKVGFQITTAAGDVSGKVYQCRIYTLSGSSLNTLIGTSDNVSGNNSWSATWVYFPFSTRPTLTGGTSYSIVFGLPPGTAEDASNYVRALYHATTSSINGNYALWEDDGALPYPERTSATGDITIRIYYYD